MRRELAEKSESTNLNRDNLIREIGCSCFHRQWHPPAQDFPGAEPRKDGNLSRMGFNNHNTSNINVIY